MPDQIDLEFEQDFGSGPPPAGTDTASEFDEAFPDEPALSFSGEAPAAQIDTGDRVAATAQIEHITPNVSLIDDFHEKIRSAAKSMRGGLRIAHKAKLVGPVESDMGGPSLIASDDILAHAAQSGLGDVWAVAKNPASKKDWYSTGLRRADAFMRAAGYIGLATEEEAAEIQSAYLFGELTQRTPLHPETLRRATQHSLKALVAERRQRAAEVGEQDPAFFNAAAYLDSMDDEEALELRGYLSTLSDRPPRNDQEALLLDSKPGGAWPYGWAEIGPHTMSMRFPAKARDALKTVLGADFPEANVLNRMESDEQIWRLKDLGFVDGDLTKPGVRVPSPGGYSDVALVPSDTIQALERRKRERGIETPFTVSPTPDDVRDIQQQTGAAEEEATLIADNVAAALTAEQTAAALPRMGREPDEEELLPFEFQALSPAQALKARAFPLFGKAFEAVMAPLDALREAQRGRLGGDVGRIGVHILTGRDDIAREADDMFDVVTVGMGLLNQFETMKSVGEKAALEMAQSQWELPIGRVVEEAPGLRGLDPKTSFEILTETNSLSQTWGKAEGREAVRAEEKQRQVRMSTWERGFAKPGYGRLSYMKDLFLSGAHNVWEGLGTTAAAVVDNPQRVPALIAAELTGDVAVAGAISTMRRAVTTTLNAGMARSAMRQVLRYAPHEVERLKRIATNRLALAETGSDAEAVFRDLAAEAQSLETQWSAVRRGGQTPGRDSMERVVDLWRRASDLGPDFELDGLVQRMMPRGGLKQFVNALSGFRRKAPIHMTRAGLDGLARSYRLLAGRVARSLGRDPVDMHDAVDLELKASRGDVTAAAELAKRQGGHVRPVGLAERIEMGVELEAMTRELAEGRSVDVDRFDLIRTKLWGEPDMADLDAVTMMQLDDSARWKPDSVIGRTYAKWFGYSVDQMKQLTSTAKKLLDFSVHDAANFYLAKFNAEMTNMRRISAYRFAKNRVKLLQGEAELAGDGKAVAAARAHHHRLEVEERSAAQSPVERGFDLTDDTMLMQTLSEDDLKLVMQSEPELFGETADLPESVSPRSFFETPSLEGQLRRIKRLESGEAYSELNERLRDNRNALRREKDAQRKEDLKIERAALKAERSELRREIAHEAAKLHTDIEQDFLPFVTEQHALDVARLDLDTMGAAGMPFWQLARRMREIPRIVSYRQAVELEKFGTLYKKLEEVRGELDAVENTALDEALRKRGPLPASIRDDPTLRHAYEMSYPDGQATKWRNVRMLVDGVESLRVGLLQDAFETGRIDKGLYNALRKKGYDPHVYELYEVSKSVRDADLADLRRGGSRAQPGEPEGVKGKEFLFQRSTLNHRVRVRERDGLVRDKEFPTREKALKWIRKTYGAETAKKFDGDGDVLEAATPTQDPIVLSAPLSRETLELLGLADKTPEAQLRRLSALSRDNHMNLFLRSLRSTGMVVSPREFSRLLTAEGRNQPDLHKQFRELPNDRTAFGDLAGWKVHRKVFAEIHNYAETFESFRSWQEGIAEIYRAGGGSIPEELVNRTPGRAAKIYRGSVRAAKTALILNNPRVWAGNVLFNLALSHLVGGDIFKARNAPNLALAWKETFRPGATRSPEWMDFVRRGFGQTSAFDVEVDPVKTRSDLRLLGLDTPAAVKSRVAKYEAIRQQYQAALDRGDNPGLVKKLETHLVALRAAEAHYDQSRAKRIGNWLSGYMLIDKDLLGLPRNKLAVKLKQYYSAIDDFFKFANYLNLKGKVGPEQAAWEINEHFQDYSRVPYAIGQLSNNPLGALVPSFGYELLRITRNLSKNHPLRFAAFASMVPALNAVSAMAGGVTEDRLDTFLYAAGHRNAWERTKSQFLEFRIWSPTTHEPILTVNLGQIVPFANIGEGKGFIPQLAEEIFPEQERSLGGGILAQGMEALSIAVGNNPVLNSAATLFFNRDPLTGAQVLDRLKARPKDWGKAMWKTFGRNYVPSAGTILLEDIPSAMRAPVDPATGRSVGAPSMTELVSGLFGVRVKGLEETLRRKSRVEGRPLGRDETVIKSVIFAIKKPIGGVGGTPQIGPDADVKWYWTALQDPDIEPERKEKLEKEMLALLKQERSVVLPGSDYKISTTERQEWMRLEAMEKRGIPALVSDMTSEEKAVMMIHLDRFGLSDGNMAEMVRTVQRTPMDRPRFEKDPESLGRAIKLLDERIRVDGASPRLSELRSWWAVSQVKASGAYKRERVRNAARRGR